MYSNGFPLFAIVFFLPICIALHDVTDIPNYNATGTYPSCALNQTLYNCTTRHACCQSQSDVLVDQLKRIKERFQGVDLVIRKDYERIKGTTLSGLLQVQTNLTVQLQPKYGILFNAFNDTLNDLYRVFIGYGKSQDLDIITRKLPHQILSVIFSRSDVSATSFPRTIKGINIFWEMNSAQRDCVVDYMLESTDIGTIVRSLTDQMSNSTQSLHEYMSLLGTMVRIIKNMVDAQETNNCIQEIVQMQQCSLCTESPVCPAFYDQLLSQCVPQLEDLYSRWDSLMDAMSELTLRLCQHSLTQLYDNIYWVSNYVVQGKLEGVVYQHGVLAYMKCVQPDSHKRSTLDSDEEETSDTNERRLHTIQNELLGDRYVYHEGDSLIEDIRLSKRAADSELTQDTTDTPTDTPTSTSSTTDKLSQCRDQLGLSFPPLDLGTTTLLNISVNSINTNCWNGSEVGSYYVDTISSQISRHPEALAIRELDEKMCRYTRECMPREDPPILNNSHHGPTLFQVMASLVASIYCCC